MFEQCGIGVYLPAALQVQLAFGSVVAVTDAQGDAFAAAAPVLRQQVQQGFDVVFGAAGQGKVAGEFFRACGRVMTLLALMRSSPPL